MKRIADELEKTRWDQPDKPIAPWAVNLIVHRTNQRYEADLELIRKHRPPIVITSLGNPAPVVEIVHGYGGLVFRMSAPWFTPKRRPTPEWTA